MWSSPSGRALLGVAARARHAGVWICLVLLALTTAEWRLAELDLRPDEDTAVENNDDVRGGVILDRLTVFDDSRLPQVPDTHRLAISRVVVLVPLRVPGVRLLTHTPRAPPVPRSSR